MQRVARDGRSAPFARYQREVVGLLAIGRKLGAERALRLVAKWRSLVLARWRLGKPPCDVADHIMKYESQKVVCPCTSRDCSHRRAARDPEPGDLYETKFGNRWLVTGKTPKGRILVKRAGNRYDGELQWTPAMLEKLKKLRSQEAKAVKIATAPIEPRPVKGLFSWLSGKPANRDPGGRASKRRYYVYVIEQLRHGKREFYVGQTAKKPEQRFREHKRGHLSYSKGGILLRKDLYAKLNPLYSRKDAERIEKAIARALRRRGLRVKGGH